MLNLIGVGFGRTGTSSTKLALEILGISPCHHMRALIDNQPLSQKWYDVTFNGKRNWDDVFAGYQATLDWPAVTYWRELADYYPNAKLLLTMRDPDSWYDSMVKTVLPVMDRPLDEKGSSAWLRRSTSIKLIKNDTFDGLGLTNREATIKRFNAHNAEVQAAFGPDRLLVWRVQEGWKPLCDFLEKPVPNVPFPRSNSSAQFQDSMGTELG
ncbi:MAG: sulfotransferase family protein [Chloroflexota bacterium]